MLAEFGPVSFVKPRNVLYVFVVVRLPTVSCSGAAKFVVVVVAILWATPLTVTLAGLPSSS